MWSFCKSNKSNQTHFIVIYGNSRKFIATIPVRNLDEKRLFKSS